MAVKRWNGSAWVVQAGSSAATNAATPNTIIQRDGSGGFSASGTVNLPANTIIGNVSSTELGYLDGVTSSIQSQFDITKPVARLTTSAGAVGSSEAVVLSYAAPADSIVVGDVFKFTGYATRTGASTNNPIFRIRVGTTSGVFTNAAAVSLTPVTGTSSTVAYKFEALSTCRSTGTSGTMGGAASATYAAGTGHQAITAPVTVNTTVLNYIEATITANSTTNTYNFEHAILEKLPA